MVPSAMENLGSEPERLVAIQEAISPGSSRVRAGMAVAGQMFAIPDILTASL